MQSKITGVCKLYRATYDGEKCYAIVHWNSGFRAIFDDKYVYEKLVKRLKSGFVLYLEKDSCGLSRLRLQKKGINIDLRQFLMAKYNKQKQDCYKGLQVYVYKDNRSTENFLDLRRRNVYLPGKRIEYEVVDRPGHDGEKYIRVVFLDREDNTPYYIQYTPELDTMMRTPKLCYIWKHSKRCEVAVNGAYPRDIGKFIAIYKYYFDRYRGQENAIENFINDFEKIKKEDGRSVEHVNCNDHFNTFDNLLLVPLELNKQKKNYVKWFGGIYGVYTAVNDRDEILIAYRNIDLSTQRPRVDFYKCKEFNDFVDWILVHLGKRLTGKMQIAYNPTIEGKQKAVLTPSGMIVTKEITQKKAKGNAIDFWTYLDIRDVLLSRDDDKFIIWSSDRHIVINADECSGLFGIEDIGKIFPEIHGEAFIRITPVEKKGDAVQNM